MYCVKTKYLKNGKWHYHTTKNYQTSQMAWDAKDEYERLHGYDWEESTSSLIRILGGNADVQN